MKFDIPLLKNPQSLIPFKNQFNGKRFSLETSSLDAIFIPCKEDKENVSSLLSELRCYNGNIFLMPSSINDLIELNLKLFPNVQILYVDDSDFVFFYTTSEHPYINSQYPIVSLGFTLNVIMLFASLLKEDSINIVS